MHIFLPLPFNPKFENVPLNSILQILYTKSCDKGLINRVKSVPQNLGLPVNQRTSVTYWWADGRQTTTMPRTPYSIAVARQKPQNPVIGFQGRLRSLM